MTANDDWKTAWQPLIDTIGRSADDDRISWGADTVDAGTVRRYLEPLEFDCALHYDRDVARIWRWIFCARLQWASVLVAARSNSSPAIQKKRGWAARSR